MSLTRKNALDVSSPLKAFGQPQGGMAGRGQAFTLEDAGGSQPIGVPPCANRKRKQQNMELHLPIKDDGETRREP
jgi:hypothetical protein